MTVIVSFVSWGIGVPPVMAILIVYIHRVIEYGLPPKEHMASMFLPVGPFSLGAFGYGLFVSRSSVIYCD